MRNALRTIAIGFAALSGIALVACSDAGPQQAGKAPALEETQSTIASNPADPSNCVQTLPLGSLEGPDPGKFESCSLYHSDTGTWEYGVQPTFVVRLTDCRNGMYCGQQAYGNIACDGYQLPFPTPWVYDPNIPGSTCRDPVHCLPDPGPYDFEHAAFSGGTYGPPGYAPQTFSSILGLVDHEFTVRQLAYAGIDKSGQPSWNVGAERLYNGTENYTQIDQMTTLVTSSIWPEYTPADVNPHVRKCTYVFQYDAATNKLVQSQPLFHSNVGQGHDPINWPD